MAHMKMIFYPMLLLSLFRVISCRDIREMGAPILGGLAVMPLVIAAFFTYWVFVRHEVMFVDIVLYIASIAVAVLLAKRWRTAPFVRRNWPLWIVVALLGMMVVGALTDHAPDWIIFADLG